MAERRTKELNVSALRPLLHHIHDDHCRKPPQASSYRYTSNRGALDVTVYNKLLGYDPPLSIHYVAQHVRAYPFPLYLQAQHPQRFRDAFELPVVDREKFLSSFSLLQSPEPLEEKCDGLLNFFQPRSNDKSLQNSFWSN